jgi:hypothetical protein
MLITNYYYGAAILRVSLSLHLNLDKEDHSK